VGQLQDLYDAEQQSIKVLPKMIQEAKSDELRAALSEHLEVTMTQAERIETICEELDTDPENEKCKGMEGVLKEGGEMLKGTGEEVRDAAIIAAGQRVEHYEIAGYGTARAYAELLGYDEAANMLAQTLEEEKEADQTLSSLAEGINMAAQEAEVKTSKSAESTSYRKATAGKNKAGTRGKRVA
jgi:ferritin-like metal-binding protein YciE